MRSKRWPTSGRQFGAMIGTGPRHEPGYTAHPADGKIADSRRRPAWAMVVGYFGKQPTAPSCGCEPERAKASPATVHP